MFANIKVDDLGGTDTHPRVVENYDGGPIPLGDSGYVLDPEMFPHLKECAGKTVITTDGTSVLGADDKAGAAEIMTLCERLIREQIPHGRISVCFTPDEEIGHGASLLDLEKFGADFAFTCDGSAPGEMEYETFNAAAAKLTFHGLSVHPGTAKGRMINAMLVAMEANAMLPAHEIPSETEGREGFYHLVGAHGDVTSAELTYIIRDHDAALFEERKRRIREVADAVNAKYGPGTAECAVRDQYRNMVEVVEKRPEILDLARDAIRAAGLEPVSTPVRGGTDGSQLSFRGLPCPNLGTGGFAYHGPFEHITLEGMEKVRDILIALIKLFAEKKK